MVLILNQLTLETFDKLSTQLLELLKPQDEAVLKRAIACLTSKSQDEPKFSGMYADLCRKLHECLKAEGEGDHKEGDAEAADAEKEKAAPGKRFRQLLLEQCEAEFKAGLDAPGRAALDALTPEERELKELKAKIRRLGHVVFVGELYKLQLIKTRIMHEAIESVLERPDNESLEVLCKMLSTVGARLDSVASESSRTMTNGYFSKLQEYIAHPERAALVPRVVCLMTDVLELRDRKYVARREEEVAKTLAEIRHDTPRGPPSRGSGRSHGTRTPPAPAPAPTADGWSTVPARTRRPVASPGREPRGAPAAPAPAPRSPTREGDSTNKFGALVEHTHHHRKPEASTVAVPAAEPAATVTPPLDSPVAAAETAELRLTPPTPSETPPPAAAAPHVDTAAGIRVRAAAAVR